MGTFEQVSAQGGRFLAVQSSPARSADSNRRGSLYAAKHTARNRGAEGRA